MKPHPEHHPITEKLKNHFSKLNKYLKDEAEFFDESVKFLKLIRNESILVKLIQEVLADEEYLKEIASNSYRHVNHFSKIVFINDTNQENCRLTMHIWKPPYIESELSQELIHDHRFSFASYVACGKQVHEIFEEDERPSLTKVKFQKYKYLPSQSGNIHDCFFDKDVYLKEVGVRTVESGSVYTLENQVIHRIVFPEGDEPIISFLVRGPRKRNFTYTYNTFYPRSGTVSNVPMYTAAELRELLKYVLLNVEVKK
ncbi:hypothetical protein [Providencia sp. PROV255]|uniref:hypothetical protein n=1 Tax=Providencia sp. PROV255 TaxID=2949943 RepID=UPI00234A6DC1|nr:hypothetical protein [Providencia sp. PROV255]